MIIELFVSVSIFTIASGVVVAVGIDKCKKGYRMYRTKKEGDVSKDKSRGVTAKDVLLPR